MGAPRKDTTRPHRVAALWLWRRRPTHRTAAGRRFQHRERFWRVLRGLRKGGGVVWVVGPLLWLFAPAITDGQIAAFRDGAHYYIPLWSWMRDEAALQGVWPRWNPWENGGVPLAGDPTAALWYPGLWLFRLPLPFAVAYNAFLAVHLALAAIGASRAAAAMLAADQRGPRTTSRPGPLMATRIAGAAYALSGSVLFNYSNPIYLVGAAWLPWGVAALVRWFFPVEHDGPRAVGTPDGESAGQAAPLTTARGDSPPGPLDRRHYQWLPPASFVVPLAMMVTGGDPQGAVHLLLMGLVAAWPRRGATSDSLRRRVRRFVKSLGGLAIAGTLAALLAAPLVLPALAALKTSERTAVTVPNDRFAANRYEFSVGPWRWLELGWPNIGGRMFPTHHRWFSALPAEGRVWTPSLYAGAIPLLLAIMALTDRTAGRLGGHSQTVAGWLRFVLLAAWLAACGHYGLGWLLRELRGALGAQMVSHELGGQVGGLYWLLTSLLPGYAWFRYPAKWTVVGTLALALLAARGWTVFARYGSQTKGKRLLAVAAIIAVLGAALVELLPRTEPGQRWLAQVGSDDWFGPFSADGLRADLRGAWLSGVAGIALLAAVAVLPRIARALAANRRPPRRIRSTLRRCASWAPAVVTVWMIVDLLASNGWMIAWLPADRFATARLPSEEETASARFGHPRDRWYRASSRDWWPESWRQTSSAHRLAETTAWERSSLFPKMNLLDRQGVISIEDAWNAGEWRAMLSNASTIGQRRADGVAEPSVEFLRAMSVRRIAFPATAPLANDLANDARSHPEDRREDRPEDRIGGRTGAAGAGVAGRRDDDVAVGVVELSDPFPRAWLVNEVEWWPAPPANVADSPEWIDRRRRDVLVVSGGPRDFARSAVVELAAGERPPPVRFSRDASSTAADRWVCQVLDERAGTRTVVAGESSTAALLVLNDAYDAGWTATLRVESPTNMTESATADVAGTRLSSRSVPVYRVNRLMRGVVVPAGRWSVEFRYRSMPETLGSWLAAGLGVPGLYLLAWMRRRVGGGGTAGTI